MYLVAFFASKTYLSTEKIFHLHGAFWFFGAVNCMCFVYLYFHLPETEGKSLQEIEGLFARKGRRNLRDEGLG
jgi:predicted MFS family arabinose efflux permease